MAADPWLSKITSSAIVERGLAIPPGSLPADLWPATPLALQL